MIAEIESSSHRVSELFLSFVPNQLEQAESFHSLDDEPEPSLEKSSNQHMIEMQPLGAEPAEKEPLSVAAGVQFEQQEQRPM